MSDQQQQQEQQHDDTRRRSRPETGNDNEQKKKNSNKQQNQQQQESSNNSTTRKGSAFPMRHPAHVQLHSNDFEFEEYAKKKRQELAEKEQQQQKQQQQTSVAAESGSGGGSEDDLLVETEERLSRTNSNVSNNNNLVELSEQDAQAHNAKQGDAWDLHYRRSQDHFFPIKNYLSQAFRKVILPLLPPIENPEGRNELDEARKKAEDGEAKTEQEEKPLEQDQTTTNTPAPAIIESKFIIECGCGSGSSLLPIMRTAGNIHRYAGFDISATAVELFRKHEIVQNLIKNQQQHQEQQNENSDSSSKKKNNDNDDDADAQQQQTTTTIPPALFAHDIAAADIPADLIPPRSADVCLLIFVLSAIERSRMKECIRRLADVMKANSFLCFRDYGMFDNSFFRFQKNGNKTCNGSFVKGDQTQQYFFELEEVKQLFEEDGYFETVDLMYHCNKLTNRKTGVEMHKIIVNGIFKRK